MAPTRCGGVPAIKLIRYCYSGLPENDILDLCMKTGGFVSHLGTSDALQVFEQAQHGETDSRLIWDTMIYQIVKEIGAMAAVLHGRVDGILLGGGMVKNKSLVTAITDACCSCI